MVSASILVADDNAENRALARATLDDEGYRVTLANNGEEAVARASVDRPDCILMDIRMPVVDGIAACTRIRALPGGDDIAIIFVTAQRDVETFDRAVAAGGDDFITKPYRPDELLVRVQTALRLRRIAVERSALFAELKQQRDRLQRLELQKEQLVAFLVHDLKNPVHAIDLYAQIVKRAADDPDRVRGAASKIVEETHALVRMITNLLDISRADEAQLAPTRCDVELSELVERARGELAVRAEATSVRLDMSLPPTRMLVDPDLISRVVVNLVDNAIRHAPEASIVRTTAVRQGDHVEIRIADSGPGIPSDQRTTVFERFQRSGDHATRSNRGLGLAFCKLAVEAHGGTIWVEDGAPGAVFCVRLPDVQA